MGQIINDARNTVDVNTTHTFYKESLWSTQATASNEVHN